MPFFPKSLYNWFTLLLLKMDTDKYNAWKQQVDAELDSLVAQNFSRLYHANGEYGTIWGEISRELHRRYDLLGVKSGDPEFELKQRMQHYVGVSLEIYRLEEFPHELMTDRTSRFVQQYGKLPKQLPDEWGRFELEERVQAGNRRREEREEFMAVLDDYAARHPQYARK